MTKEEKIQQVYGKYWNEWKEDINDNGFLETTLPLPNIMIKELGLKKHTLCTYTPIELIGIENNNGWIKYEDKSIMKWNDSFDIVFTDKGNIYTYATYCNFSSIYELEKITHFQQITKPEKPIY